MAKYYTPEMLIHLRQWIGRVLRQKDDIGVIVLMDAKKFSRMAAQIREAMPKGIRLVRTLKEVEVFLTAARKRA